ncbi:NAD kinase [Psychromicrobium xiongbiense]|uniref:NAD kinase n=1 Tax=Psychromicrobium xiongbiense TaxID=3051184 RepID=UPI00255784EA|nr:NAD kinase [Psychromicrobium sp. YIM S02556]
MSEMRNILILAHTGREEALTAALRVCGQLQEAGLRPAMTEEDFADLAAHFGPVLPEVAQLGRDLELAELELVMVLGGDGTILRAAELVRGTEVPVLGVNLGHVGFLAESERADLKDTVHRVVARDYTVEERMTIDVTLFSAGVKVAHTWALNEVSVEKSDRARMLEMVIEVDGRPLSSFGCDGVVMSTPTGSTAYAFSAGGPVVWPEVEAMLMVPLSAHALFARPLVVSPQSMLAVEVVERTQEHGIMWCDGRRSWPVLPGSRIEVTRSATPVRLARTRLVPFSERLVRKFELPVQGWRGPRAAAQQAGTEPIPLVHTKPRITPDAVASESALRVEQALQDSSTESTTE